MQSRRELIGRFLATVAVGALPAPLVKALGRAEKVWARAWRWRVSSWWDHVRMMTTYAIDAVGGRGLVELGSGGGMPVVDVPMAEHVYMVFQVDRAEEVGNGELMGEILRRAAVSMEEATGQLMPFDVGEVLRAGGGIEKMVVKQEGGLKCQVEWNS